PTVQRTSFPTRRSSDLLTVDQPEKLAKPLPIASKEKLEKLDAGAPVAYIGYPLENLALSSLAAKPTPQSKVGNLTTVTDYFNIQDRKSTRLNSSHVKIS